MSVSQDGSESVDQFLARIASVREGRDMASEERARRKEEDFLKSRKERQARRLERARSLSPSKTGPSVSTTFQQSPALARDTALNPPVDFSPRASTLSRSNAVSARTSPKLEPKRSDQEPSSTSQNLSLSSSGASGLSRSGTLSWQQRPPRDGGAVRPRPLSTIESIRPISRLEDEQAENKSEPTRQEIAASLGLKDPTWFRQTQERGMGSAALRKNQVEDAVTVEHSTRSHSLVGMSREVSRSASATPSREIEPSVPPRETRLFPSPNGAVGRGPSPTPAGLSTKLKLEPSPQQASHAPPQPPAVSNDLARTESIRAGRSPSPTKGLGGFVESAMMKRSDSVNKRWSVQAGAGLKRGDSIAGVRPLSGVRSMHASSLSRSSNRDVSSSPIPMSRPESREGPPGFKSRSTTPDGGRTAKEVPEETHSPKASDLAEEPPTSTDEALSRSPSKTLDSRRWSPTKSSWLESALLSKPDPPKPQAAKEEIPAWKATLQRNKASRDLSPDKTKIAEIINRDGPFQSSPRTQQPPVVAKKPDLVLKSAQPLHQKAEMESEELRHQDQTPAAAASPPAKESKGAVEQPKPEAHSDEKPETKPPPVLKPKPQTPPKTDFRSTLRSRAPVATGDHETEPEFKSVFGKLKRAQTQNYVAPDTLKDNILSGKASLAVTGGPQRTQRVDEFKESILQKKEAMKANALEKKEKPALETNTPESAIPEALARRKTLHKPSPSISKVQVITGGPQSIVQEKPKPAITTKPKPSSIQPSIASPDLAKKPSALVEEPQEEKGSILPEPESKTLPPVRQPLFSATPSTISQKAVLQSTKTELPAPQGSSSLPVVEAKAEPSVGSKLASRLNPNLAALLSRSGSPHLVSSKPSSPERQNSESVNATAGDDTKQDLAAGGELTHMTKGRARGPKRRAPKSQPTKDAPSVGSQNEKHDLESTVQPEIKARAALNKPVSTFREPSIAQSPPKAISIPKPTSAVSLTTDVTVSPTRGFLDTETKPKAKPMIASKSPELRRVSSPVVSQQTDGSAGSVSNTPQFEIATDSDNNKPADVQSAPKEVSTAPKQLSNASPLTPSKSRINTPRAAQSPTIQPTKPQSSKPAAGLGVSIQPLKPKPSVSDSQLTPPPERPRKPSSNVKLQPRSAPNENLTSVLAAYFTTPPNKQQKAEFDAEELLARAQRPTEKTKSLSHAIWEVSGDGKKSSIPSQQEHVLFEESLYLVTHTFEGRAGSRVSEVYLWCGDDVADAAIEDAQLFCRKDARDYNTKLEVVRQGKEPARFFQALGGILIVRRSKTSSSYMLRGRRHLGHISFDEVDLASSNLCSGFSYLISTTSEKLYLWKGKGSGADEVGSARLIGMDLGLTGGFEEVAEGEEPSSFWGAFAQRSQNGTQWSDDWQRRASHKCYPSTLYRIDLDRPKSSGGFWGLRAASPPKPFNKAVVEMIHPFSGRDVDPSNVYILDAYRTIYVILDPLATTKSSEIVTAFYLAQDLAMLSPSIQDRSLIPSCFVAFGEPPADVKAAFRKWDERNTARLGSGTDRDRLSTCVRLEDVIEALQL